VHHEVESAGDLIRHRPVRQVEVAHQREGVEAAERVGRRRGVVVDSDPSCPVVIAVAMSSKDATKGMTLRCPRCG
jgi:hypothetical protein